LTEKLDTIFAYFNAKQAMYLIEIPTNSKYVPTSTRGLAEQFLYFPIVLFREIIP
jgi:hypothetical protein